jgi:hypothetical protein
MASSIISDLKNGNGVGASLAGNRYFSTVTKQASFLGVSSSPYVVLKPSGSGVVDVYREMYWSNLGDKSEVPSVFITEKELQYGAWATQLGNILSQTNNIFGKGGSNASTVDSFIQLYAAENTGFYYHFPWLIKNGDTLRNIQNSWETTQGISNLFTSTASNAGGVAGAVGSVIGAGIGLAVGTQTPGFGFEDTKQYSSTSQQTLTISFPLFNTMDIESAFNHFSFVNLITFQSLKTRTSLMSYIPPKIYEVDGGSVGGVYMAAAVISDLKIESIGTSRRMSDYRGFGPNDIIIPEAYKVTITFTDLLSQSSNVFSGAIGGTKITVTDGGDIFNRGIVNGVQQTAGQIVQGYNQKANELGGQLYEKATQAPVGGGQ